MPEWVEPLAAVVSTVILLILLPMVLKSATKHDLEVHAESDAEIFREIRGQLSNLNQNLFTILATIRNGGSKPPVP